MDTDIYELENDIIEELDAVISDLCDNKKSSVIKDVQPTQEIILAMARAGAAVLIAFERGYRLGD